MDMQLRNQIAQGRDIELVAAEGLKHPGAKPAGLVEQCGAIGRAEFEDLAHARNPRHQNHPGITAVIEQKDTRQAKIADRMRVRRELRMEDEILQRAKILDTRFPTVSISGLQADKSGARPVPARSARV